MSFTANTTAALAEYEKQYTLVLELRTNFAESNTWLEFGYVRGSLRISYTDNRPAVLNADLVWNSALAQERSKTTRPQQFAEFRVTAFVNCPGADPPVLESEVVCQGRIDSIDLTDTSCRITAADWGVRLDETECEVSFTPSQVVIREDWDGLDAEDETNFREVVVLTTGPHVFGFEHEGGTTDPAFTQAGQAAVPQELIRRPWVPSAARLYSYDPTADPPETFADKQPVASTNWSIDWHAGALTIAEDVTGKRYYLTNVRCYLESAADGATDVDLATVLKAALQYPAADGGIEAASGELDFPATLGLDLASALYYRGETIGLVRDLQKAVAPHLRLYYAAHNGKWTLTLTEQKAAGSEDLALLHAKSAGVLRATRDLVSRIVVTGKEDYPANSLSEPGAAITVGGDLGAGVLFTWNKSGELQGSGTFDELKGYLWDEDGDTGMFASNLDGDYAYRYSHWYTLFERDYGELRNIEYVSVVMPHTRNPKAASGHQGGFWPGCRILVSTDGTDWQLLTPLLDGRYKPLSQVQVTQDKLLCPRARYVRVLAAAYKYSLSNGDDPAIGFNEIKISTSVTYHEALEIDKAASPATYYHYSRPGAAPWQRNHPDLWTRLGGRHKTRIIDFGSKYTKSAARDLGLSYLDEQVRLFEGLSFTSVCDPRPRLYQTAAIVDSFNGFSGSLLIERLTLTDTGVTVEGTNYLAEGLDND